MQVEIILNESEKGYVELFDTNGKVIHTYELNPGSNNIDIYKTLTSPGTYTYKIIVNNKVLEKRHLIVMN